MVWRAVCFSSSLRVRHGARHRNTRRGSAPNLLQAHAPV